MINLSKPQAGLVKELQQNPGASFLFQGYWEIQKANGLFGVYKSKPAWGTFKVLMRYGLIKQEVIHQDYVRYSLTDSGNKFQL